VGEAKPTDTLVSPAVGIHRHTSSQRHKHIIIIIVIIIIIIVVVIVIKRPKMSVLPAPFVAKKPASLKFSLNPQKYFSSF